VADGVVGCIVCDVVGVIDSIFGEWQMIDFSPGVSIWDCLAVELRRLVLAEISYLSAKGVEVPSRVVYVPLFDIGWLTIFITLVTAVDSIALEEPGTGEL